MTICDPHRNSDIVVMSGVYGLHYELRGMYMELASLNLFVSAVLWFGRIQDSGRSGIEGNAAIEHPAIVRNGCIGAEKNLGDRWRLR